jgi:anti-anti-sigma regulatory factor
MRVRVRIEPVGLGFSADLISYSDGIVNFALDGDLSRSKLSLFKKEVEKLSGLKGMVLDMTNLNSVDDIGWNYLLFMKQQRGADFSLTLMGMNAQITQSLKDAELDEEFTTL